LVKLKFIFILLLGSASAFAVEQREIQRLAALADYVAADYPGAVKNGQIVAQDEYDEQRALLKEAQVLAAKLPHREAIEADLKKLAAEVDARADAAVVAATCRVLHKRLIDEHGLILAPLATPSKERAQGLFATHCAICHGADGRAQTEKAKELKPPPASFFDDEKMARVSPSLAFHALTFGVPGTGMASFDNLPASDRWSLAFYVVSLRHQSQPKEKPRDRQIATTASRLAELTDQDLDKMLGGNAKMTAWLRSEASFAAAPGGSFGEARRLLAEVGQAADTREKARELAIAAYLEGIEPHEAILRARDPAVADRVEKAFFELRHAIDQGTPDDVRKQVLRVSQVLDSADELAAGGWTVPFFASLAIALREGFELSLLIAALLAFVRKSGHPEEARWVHTGWLLSIPAGVVSWFVVGAALQGARRELTEGVLTLVAAMMLLFVSHFVLGKLESRKWLKFLEKRTVAAARSSIHWPLASMAFLAAYREALEIVLFYRALVLGAPGHGGAILAGAGVAIAGLTVLVMVMSYLGKRLNPRPVMMASSVLLTALAVSLVGQGIHALQEGGYLSLTPLASWNVPSIGLYANWQGLAAQGLVVLLVLVPWYLERRKSIMTA
jgi:high-affinity iron transporter